MIDLKNDNLLINKEVNEYLKNIIERKVFSNGYIFFGPRGVGKKRTAINFIKEIFNQYPSRSNILEKIINNNHPDFLLIEPTYFSKGNLVNRSENESSKNKKETIRIEQIRNIKNFLAKKSIESEKKIVLIVDAELLNESASNCLLKILEEPTNGLFILLTSRLNSLLDTIISRCQLIRFKSFSYKQLDKFIRNNVDSSTLNILEEVNIKNLINSADGSPGKVLNNIQMWQELPIEIRDNLKFPLRNNFEILKMSKIITEDLDIDQQLFLVNFLQKKCWEKTKNKNIIELLENLKLNLINLITPRLAWEVALLKIAIED